MLDRLANLPFPLLLLTSAALHAALIVYGDYQDSHSPLKYTDVDYQVFTDAARFVVRPEPGEIASGWLTSVFRLPIGDPYTRATYRYTPFLALLLTPNIVFHPSFGKVLFSLANILISVLLRRLTPSDVSPSYLTLLWTLNPFPLNISTRGSSEALVGLCVISCLQFLQQGRTVASAVMLGIGTHLKIYPFIYGVAALSHFSRGRLWLTKEGLLFGVVSAGTFFTLGAAMYSIWGFPFLEHAYLYHLTRLDHRHNFSPFFYLTYLTYGSKTSIISSLVGFVPQLCLSLSLGWKFGSRDLTGAWASQTAAFVMLNKVCTSQYFMWYLWFLPLIIPRFRIGRAEGLSLFGAWVLSQALWLSIAFQLEFNGQQTFLPLWGAAAAFVVVNAVILARLLTVYTWDAPASSDSGK